jgi:hypothetical protein
MKFCWFIAALSMPIYALAWDGSGYDYKRGRSIQNQPRYAQGYELPSPRIDPEQLKYHEHQIDAFERLGNSFLIEIPDPSNAMQSIIQTTPNYVW